MILQNDFFDKDCLRLAPDLVGKILVRRLENGEELRVRITETEAYRLSLIHIYIRITT